MCVQMKRDLEEAIQLCETVGFEKVSEQHHPAFLFGLLNVLFHLEMHHITCVNPANKHHVYLFCKGCCYC